MKKLNLLFALVVLAALIIVPGFLKNYGIHMFTTWLVFIIATMGLNLTVGYAGQKSLGHAAFFGMGAYVAALFAKFILPDPLVGLLVAIGVSTLLGAVCSMTIIRGSDLTRLMVTLGVAMMLFELANKMTWLTGGEDGLQGMEVQPVLGMFRFDMVAGSLRADAASEIGRAHV